MINIVANKSVIQSIRSTCVYMGKWHFPVLQNLRKNIGFFVYFWQKAIAISASIVFTIVPLEASASPQSGILPSTRSHTARLPISSGWSVSRRLASDGAPVCDLSIRTRSRVPAVGFILNFIFKAGMTTSVTMTYNASLPYHIEKIILGVDANRFAAIEVRNTKKNTLESNNINADKDYLSPVLMGYLNNPQSSIFKIEVADRIFEAEIRG